MKKRLLVFASGGEGENEGGSGFEKLVLATMDGGPLDGCEIVGVVSNHPEGGVYHRAKKLGIPCRYFSGPWTAEEYQKLVAEFQPDLICLSGWLKPVLGLDPRITINIHPGPLPRFGGKGFYGHHVHEAVMEAYRRGEITHSAVTMHFVTEEYDKGPVIFVKKVPILPDDTAETLAKRVNQVEHQYQPIVTKLVAIGDIRWDGVNRDSLVTPPWCLKN